MDGIRGQQEALARLILEATPRDGSRRLREGVQVNRLSSVNQPLVSLPKPAFCVIAQGAKVVHLGTERFRYDPELYLIASVDLPVSSQVVEASPDRPYLSLRMELDAALVTSVLLETGTPEVRAGEPVRAMDVSVLDAALRDAVIRLVHLALAQPDGNDPYLVALVQREIVYRLLTGNQGARLRYMMAGQAAAQGIVAAIDRLRREFDQPLRMEALAQDLGMSVSALHHRFKEVTAMSPLQFQKQVRLQEARRLMVQEGFDATTAGLQVGYGSMSQFSREYKRQFGEPPMRDIERLRLDSTATSTAPWAMPAD